MLYGFLITFFVILCFLMILLILIQKSKGSLGIIGSAGSGAQMLFGGTGGQDLFQKITWTFIALFIGGSLVLAIIKNASVYESRYLGSFQSPVENVTLPLVPSESLPSTAAQDASVQDDLNKNVSTTPVETQQASDQA